MAPKPSTPTKQSSTKTKSVVKTKTRKTTKTTTTANETTVTSSVAAKTAPSSNWKSLLQSKIKAAPRKAPVVVSKGTKRKHEEVNGKDSDAASQKDTDSKARKVDLSSERTLDSTQLWFDDITKDDLEKAYGRSGGKSKSDYDPTETGKNKIGKYIGIDCEMVGVGPEGIESALARVSLVNFHGVPILDLYVKPAERVTDYRTAVSGITPKLLAKAVTFKDAQKQVADIIQDKIVVGHAVHNDFKALLLDHPQKLTRDTSRYQPFRAMAKGRSPALKRLALDILGIRIQDGSHSSVEDARITILLYRKHKEAWDSSIAVKDKRRAERATKNKKE